MRHTDPKGLWLLRTHHRMRSASFAMVFAASYLHLQGKDYSPLAWTYLVVLLLVYPQVLYRLAQRASALAETALRLLLLDSFLLGLFCAVVRFSDWLSFSVSLATLINSASNCGMRSTWRALLVLSMGAGLGFVLCDYQFSPHTEGLTVPLCMLGLSVYVLEVGHIAFHRNTQLRLTQGQLRLRERALVDANERLLKSLQENDALRKDLAVQASRDALTNLYNRRYLDVALPRDVLRCQRESKPLAVILMDVDHFKKYNDHYGHAAGDDCLRTMALCIQASARRASDLAARYGGEEFLLLLPDTDADDALALAEALRQSVAALQLPHQRSPLGRVSLSLGVAVCGIGERASPERLLRRADLALYAAKEAGRDRSFLAPRITAPASL